MKKLIVLSIAGLLAACQSEAPPEEAVAGEFIDNSPEAIEKDLAAKADPTTESGKVVNADALQAAFDADCDGTKVQNASCKTTDEPTEFRCDYALEGDNVFSMKNALIAEDGDGWKLIDIANHCTKQ